MDCFCGCGTKLDRHQGAYNLQAAEIALELLAWDKARSAGYLGSPPDANLELLIENGAEIYQRLLATLHGEDVAYEEEEGKFWRQASLAERRDRQYMTESSGFLKSSKLVLTDEDRERLDRVRPELSYSGRVVESATDEGAAAQLERLGILHREGILTDEEFSAARDRVLSSE